MFPLGLEMIKNNISHILDSMAEWVTGLEAINSRDILKLKVATFVPHLKVNWSLSWDVFSEETQNINASTGRQS